MLRSSLSTEYEPEHTFREVFSKLINDVSKHIDHKTIVLKASLIDTILGPMIAIADDNYLYLLEFFTKRTLEQELKRLRQRGFVIIPENALPLLSIETELKDYFAGSLTQFKTPYQTLGTPFQQQVWQVLCSIPYGETKSYAGQSQSLGKPNAYRAVANANGANQLSIIIPCHRVIASDGTLGGYGGGLAVKQWLLEHEKRHKSI